MGCRLHLIEVVVVAESDLVELDPAVSDVLPLPLLESALALILALEEDRGLSGLGAVRVLAYLDRVMVCIEVVEEGDDVFMPA